MKSVVLIVFLLISNFLFSQDTTVLWIRNIDTLAFKLSYDKQDIPKEFYKTIGISSTEQIANPSDNWTSSCMNPIHHKLEWIAKDKNNHWVISITYGGRASGINYYLFDMEKVKLNINELLIYDKYLTLGSLVNHIKAGKYEFEDIEPSNSEDE